MQDKQSHEVSARSDGECIYLVVMNSRFFSVRSLRAVFFGRTLPTAAALQADTAGKYKGGNTKTNTEAGWLI